MIGAREATILFLLVLFAVGGCGKGSEPEERAPGRGRARSSGSGTPCSPATIIDRLVPEDERIPLTFEERREFVRRWVDTEVLRQEAIRRGLKNDPVRRGAARASSSSSSSPTTSYSPSFASGPR